MTRDLYRVTERTAVAREGGTTNSILLQVGTGKPRARVLIVDDHPIFREGLTQSLSREEDLAVCGEAENAAQALDSVPNSAPDLVIVDITLPGKSGLDLIPRSGRCIPSCQFWRYPCMTRISTPRAPCARARADTS